jgi:ParB family chromosome partitioning protein
MNNLDTVQLIPVDAITVLNPRVRNKAVFNELVRSIAHLGLKKPITVSRKASGTGFDLVCGQGRLEAFIQLGATEIPAIVVEATEEDCFVMSLVENLARRQHTPLELVHEIGALRQRGYSDAEIAEKTDFSEEYISALGYLLDHGEDRLLAAVERGVIPPSIAMEIARAKDQEVQVALTEAYERKTLPGTQILAIRRIIEQRNLIGKGTQSATYRTERKDRKVTSTGLVRAYRKETDRQQLLVRKAAVAQQRLIFVVNALRQLLADENFVTLLRAESMHTLPRTLADRVAAATRV